MIEYRDHITRQMLRDELDTLFVFGDNMERRGLGGQAAEMRGEPNAVGIPTKRRPSMDDGAFLNDKDCHEWFNECVGAMSRLVAHNPNGTIVWPSAGIGTGLAQLESRAPLIWQTLEVFKSALLSVQTQGRT